MLSATSSLGTKLGLTGLFRPLDFSETFMCHYTILSCCTVGAPLCKSSNPPFHVNIKLPTPLDTRCKPLNIASLRKTGKDTEINLHALLTGFDRLTKPTASLPELLSTKSCNDVATFLHE